MAVSGWRNGLCENARLIWTTNRWGWPALDRMDWCPNVATTTRVTLGARTRRLCAACHASIPARPDLPVVLPESE